MAKYLAFEIENLEPLRISDDSTSQRGQTDTLTYIPGSVIRGIVLHGLKVEESFEAYKRILLSDQIRFMNAYPVGYGKEQERLLLLPSVKGFQEHKAEKQGEEKLYNPLDKGKKKIVSKIFSDQKPEDGMKEAKIGKYCYPKADMLYYLSPSAGSDLNLDTKKDKENLFRSEYLQKNQTFQGFIALEDEKMQEPIQAVLGGKADKKVRIGNHRTAGYGMCRIRMQEERDYFPYQMYGTQEDQTEGCYLLLLSDMAMRREDGEIAGLDLEYLQSLMQVQNLRIDASAASVKEVCGFNRTWNCRVPSVKMYEKGSVFRLSYQGTAKKEALDRIQEHGIGIRRNEGCGQVLFLSGWEKIGYKCRLDFENQSRPVTEGFGALAYEKLKDADKETLGVIAKGYLTGLLEREIARYVVENPLPRGGLSNSQIGIIQSILLRYMNEPVKGRRKLEEHFTKIRVKEEQNKRQGEIKGSRSMEKFVKVLFDQKTKLENVLDIKLPENLMGIKTERIFSQEEEMRSKVQLLLDMIRYENKEGKENG